LTEIDSRGEEPLLVPRVDRYTLPAEVADDWVVEFRHQGTVTHLEGDRLTVINTAAWAVLDLQLHRTHWAERVPLQLWWLATPLPLGDGGQKTRLAMRCYDPDTDDWLAWAVPPGWEASQQASTYGWDGIVMGALSGAVDPPWLWHTDGQPWQQLDPTQACEHTGRLLAHTEKATKRGLTDFAKQHTDLPQDLRSFLFSLQAGQ
jgi:hypothetical protein